MPYQLAGMTEAVLLAQQELSYSPAVLELRQTPYWALLFINALKPALASYEMTPARCLTIVKEIAIHHQNVK